MLEKVRRIHLIGIGGTGMAPLAQVLLEGGFAIQGSDVRSNAATARLAAAGARVFEGHSADQVDGADLVVISSAVPAANPELARAHDLGLPVFKRAEVWGELMRRQRTVAVAGTHGKTTTTAMVSSILLQAELDPTFLIGGELIQSGTGARLGKGDYLVAEADEFDGSFLNFAPWVAVLTNIEADHLDYYSSLDAIVDAFQSFIGLLPQGGHAVLCWDDARVRALKVPLGVSNASYGLTADAEWRATGIEANRLGGNDFDLLHRDAAVTRVRLRLPGRHNVANATAAMAVSAIMGIDPDIAKAALAGFRGTRRRIEFRGQAAGVAVYDDYAHHPTEIRATLSALRESHSGRLVAVFQPHTYHRTKLLLPEFAAAFDLADLVLIADIYLPSGREVDTLGISAADLVAAMHHPLTRYAGAMPETIDVVMDELRPGDLLLTMGAGDVFLVAESVLRELQKREQASGSPQEE